MPQFGTTIDPALLLVQTITGTTQVELVPAGTTYNVYLTADADTIDSTFDVGGAPGESHGQWTAATVVALEIWVRRTTLTSDVPPIGPIRSREFYDNLITVAEAAIALNGAQAAATSAAGSATAAASAAANSIPRSDRGVAGGVAPLNPADAASDVGRLDSAYLPGVVNDLIDAYEAGTIAGNDGLVPITFDFEELDPYGGDTLTAGQLTRSFPVPYPFTISKVGIDADAAHATVATATVDVEVSTGAGYSSIYGGTKPSAGVGVTEVAAATPAPSTTIVTPPGGGNARLRAKLVAVAPAPTAGGVAAAVHALSYATAGTHFNNSVAGTAASLTTTPPNAGAGAVTGDVVLSLAGNGGGATLSKAAPWVSQSPGVIGGATPETRAGLWTADWTAGLTDVLTNTGICVNTELLIHNANPADPTPQIITTSTEVDGADTVTGSGTASQACDEVLYVCFYFFKNTGASGWSMGTPSGLTLIKDQQTARVAASNMGVWVGRLTAGALAAGGTIPAKTFTLTGGTGSLANNAYNTFIVPLSRAPGSTGPLRVSTIVWIKPTE